MLKGIMENVRTISHKAENINKEIEITKRNQREFFYLKSTKTKMKNSLADLATGLSKQKKGSENF